MFLRRKRSGRLNGQMKSRSVFNGTLVILLSLCILLGLFGWKNAVAQEYSCVLEEHTHSPECYEDTSICTNEDEDHEHDEGCYEQTLICGKTEHTHKDECLATAIAEETVEQQEEQAEENAIMAHAEEDESVPAAQAEGGVTPFPGTNPPNTVVNLFDYWTTNTATDEKKEYAEKVYGGINQRVFNNTTDVERPTTYNASIDRPLIFWIDSQENYWDSSSHQNKSYGLANVWEAGMIACQGIVQNQLGEDGYPQLNWSNNNYWPTDFRYNTSLQNLNASLAYLFDSSSQNDQNNQTRGKQVYSNVDGLFQVNSDGYYYYDCTQNYAYYNQGTNSFDLYNGTAGLGQFFPFARYETAETVNGDTKSTSLNHYFGLTMTTRFVQDHGGKTSASSSAKDMVFEFSGDDDVWIFVDDVLVSDLGGIHSKSGTSINFATGEIKYFNSSGKEDTSLKTSLREQFDKVYEKSGTSVAQLADQEKGWTNSGGNYVFKDNTSHTLKFFYMERGNDQSNMKLTTNLFNRPETSIDKVDQYGDSMSGVSLAAYSAVLEPAEDSEASETDSSQYRYIVDPISSDNGQVLFDPSKVTSSMVQSDGTINVTIDGHTRTISPKTKGVTNSNGSWILTNDNGAPYTTEDLRTSVFGTDQIIVREIDVPDGYRTVSDNIFLYFDQKEHLTTPNPYESGVWPSPNVLVTATNTLHLTKYVTVNGTSTNTINNFYNVESGTSGQGTLFAVVLKRNGAKLGEFEKWSPVFGNDTSGYQVLAPGEDGNIQQVLKAYRENADNYSDPTFKSTSAGMQVTLTDLPGSLDRYYTYMKDHKLAMEEDGTEPQYLVAYYYSPLSRKDLLDPENSISSDQIVRVVTHRDLVEGYEGFMTSWSSTIQITNIENRLYYQKTDEEGNLVNGATFALYNANEDTSGYVYLVADDQNGTPVYLVDDSDRDNTGTATIGSIGGTKVDYSIAKDGTITAGTYTIKPANNADGTPCFGETTEKTDKDNLVEDGTGKFKKLNEGRYILREISAPTGYLLNTELVKVLVNEDGVYAHAGKNDDGVIVGNGAGFLIPTFNNCATLNNIDETLTWVYSLLRINTTDNGYNAYDNLNILYTPREDTLTGEFKNWEYAAASSSEVGGMSSTTTNTRSKAMVTYLEYGGNQVPDENTHRLFDYKANGDQDARSKVGYNYNTAEGQGTLRLYTDEGWSKLSILQDYLYGWSQQSTGNTTTYTNLTSQNVYGETSVNMNLAHLFSNSTFVRVADPRPVNVVLNKVDSDGNSLPGADFILYQQIGQNEDESPVNQYYSYNDGTGTTSWVDAQESATTLAFNEKNPTVTVNQLTDGTYYLKETKAPSGYIIETEPWKMVLTDAVLTKDDKNSNPTAIGKTIISLYKPGSTDVSQTATVYILQNGTAISYSQSETDFIKLVNTKIYNLPNSGSFGVLPFILAGSLILGFSVYLLIREERQAGV